MSVLVSVYDKAAKIYDSPRSYPSIDAAVASVHRSFLSEVRAGRMVSDDANDFELVYVCDFDELGLEDELVSILDSQDRVLVSGSSLASYLKLMNDEVVEDV